MAQIGTTSPAPHDVERFRELVSRSLGLCFEDAKLGFLGEVLRRRLEAGPLDAGAYLAQIERAPATAEIGSLAQELTVPETYFFRNIDQFHALAQAALPERIRAQQARQSLRLLSAGCASGEEAYSIAIAARQAVPDRSWDVSIRAVDVNPAVLERAARARFSSWALRETPAELQRKWFRKEGSEMVLDQTVRAAVRFEHRNLSLDDPELWLRDHYDVVFCRNVIMYFTPEAAHALVARLTPSLVPGGYLFLGHAETLRGLSQDFHLRHTHGTFYYQRKDATELVAATGLPAANLAQPASAPRLPARELSAFVEDATSWIDAIRRASDRIQALSENSAATNLATSARRPKPDLGSALDFLRKERFSDALDIIRSLPPESARDPDVLMLEAVLLTHSGQLGNAMETCHRLLAIDGLNAGAHYVLALCREAEGNHRQATEHDRVAAYLDPTFAMPRLHLGLLARRSGDRDATRREIGQALLLLQREDPSRLLLFGGGFSREALIGLCAAALSSSGDRP